jgi:hypothetical protein
MVGIILLVIAAGIICTGICMKAQFRAVEAAEPVRLAVDFSKPGEYSATFRQVYDYGHDQGLELHISPGLASPDDLCEHAPIAMKDLEGQILIKTAAGQTAYEGPLHPLDSYAVRYREGAVPVAQFRPFPAGDYTLSIRVDKPAAALAGRSQYVVLKHWLCGCEGLMTAHFAFLIGGALPIPGTICLIVGVARGIRSRRAKSAAPVPVIQ